MENNWRGIIMKRGRFEADEDGTLRPVGWTINCLGKIEAGEVNSLGQVTVLGGWPIEQLLEMEGGAWDVE